MFDDSRSFITRAFLRSEFELDYRAYTNEHDAILLQRLRDWDGRLRLSETQAEGAFTQTFFVDTWGYGESGRVPPDQHTIIAKLPVPGEGAGAAAVETLAQQLVAHYGAPDLGAATAAAEEEFAFAESLCNQPADTLIAVHRSFEDGEIREAFRTLRPKDGPKPARAFAFLDVEGEEEPEEKVDLTKLGKP